MVSLTSQRPPRVDSIPTGDKRPRSNSTEISRLEMPGDLQGTLSLKKGLEEIRMTWCGRDGVRRRRIG